MAIRFGYWMPMIGAVHTFWHPAIVAKMGMTINVYSKGRFAINILTSWFKEEFRAFGTMARS
jgi:FMNH2-dependent dimethyl sulfone monooxygenase